MIRQPETRPPRRGDQGNSGHTSPHTGRLSEDGNARQRTGTTTKRSMRTAHAAARPRSTRTATARNAVKLSAPTRDTPARLNDDRQGLVRRIPIDQLADAWGSQLMSPCAGWHRLPALARTLNVKEIRETPDVREALVFRERGSFIVALNGNHNAARKRFAVAHELAHLLLDPRLERAGRPSWAVPSTDARRVEKRCDDIAVSLLMPEDKFKATISRFPMGLASIPEIAALFGTSVEATAIRLCEASQQSFVMFKATMNVADSSRPRAAWCSASCGAPLHWNSLQVAKDDLPEQMPCVRRAFEHHTTCKDSQKLELEHLTGTFPVEAHGFGTGTRRYVLGLIRLSSASSDLFCEAAQVATNR